MERLFQKDTLEVINMIVSYLNGGIVVARSHPEEFVLWNDEAVRLVGRGRANISPEDWPEYYGAHEENGELCKPENLPLVKAMRGEEDKNHILFMKNEDHPKGNWILCNAMPIKREGKIIGGMVIIQDITEKQVILVELKSIKERLKSICVDFHTMN